MGFARKNFILLLAIVAVAACSKKEETPIVARVGDIKITADEFRKRFELNPRLLQFKNINQAKIRFLGSLIAEKLLASEAEHQGLSVSSRTPAFLNQIYREAVIEEFYNDKAAGFKKYFHEMMVGKKTSVPPQRLKFIAESLERAFAIGDEPDGYIHAANPSPIDDMELRQAQHGLYASLNETLVTFDDGTTWTIGEFLQRLSVGRYQIDIGGVKAFRLSLRQAVITMIEQEYVFKEAVAAGVHNSLFVQAEVRMWREAVIAREYLQKLPAFHQPTQDLQESQALTDEQLARLDDRLSSLLEAYDVQVDLQELIDIRVKNAGLLAFKTHFPGRLVVPVSLPLENFSGWQEKIREKLNQSSAEIAGYE